MTLGELKKSLAKFPPDMNEMGVYVITARKGKKVIDNLCFTGYLPLKGHESIVLGTLSEIQRMVEGGEIDPPKGYTPPNENQKDEE